LSLPALPLIRFQRYAEAAEQFFHALVMQDSDATRPSAPREGIDAGLGPVLDAREDAAEDAQGLTSGALWDSLRTASQRMGRADLATLCEKRDLEGTHVAERPSRRLLTCTEQQVTAPQWRQSWCNGRRHLPPYYYSGIYSLI
jgi:hypothetical protein